MTETPHGKKTEYMNTCKKDSLQSKSTKRQSYSANNFTFTSKIKFHFYYVAYFLVDPIISSHEDNLTANHDRKSKTKSVLKDIPSQHQEINNFSAQCKQFKSFSSPFEFNL